MNREILFRGKSINTGKWLYGHLFNYGLTAPSNVPCISVCVPTSWREAYALYTVLSKTIGQYTGMKDKNKKKIFEGGYTFSRTGTFRGSLYIKKIWRIYPKKNNHLVFNKFCFR